MTRVPMLRFTLCTAGLAGVAATSIWMAEGVTTVSGEGSGGSNSISLRAPAGNLPATRHIMLDGYDAAVLPNGRMSTARRSQPSLHCHLRSILPLRRELAHEQLACGFAARACERALVAARLDDLATSEVATHVALADCAALEIGS